MESRRVFFVAHMIIQSGICFNGYKPFGDDVFVPHSVIIETPVANRLLKEFTNKMQQQNAATRTGNDAEYGFQI